MKTPPTDRYIKVTSLLFDAPAFRTLPSGALKLYPVLARSSFGIWGANVPALVRAVVACFWYGAQTAAASGAVVALLTRSDGIMAFHKSTHFLGHSGLEV